MALLYTSGQITSDGARDALDVGFPQTRTDWTDEDLDILRVAITLVASDRERRVWTVNLIEEQDGGQVAHVVGADDVQAAAEVRREGEGVAIEMRPDAGLSIRTG